MNWSNFSTKFGDWSPYFKDFVESKEMDSIYEFLKDESRKGKTICPDSDKTYRVFEATPKDKLKIIWYLQDPYPTIKNSIKVASGIAMDCSATGILQPSLTTFYESMERELYGGMALNMEKSPSLDYLCNQGLMLINSELTVEANKSGSHRGIWLPFHKYFIEEVLNKYFSGLIYVLSGKDSQRLEEFITPFNNYTIKTEHPAASSYRGGHWDTNDVFRKINKILKDNNNEYIKWDASEGDVPF